jgi:predicted nucleic acid-binding protein
MKRIMFDTSVYGELVKEEDVLDKVNDKSKTHEFVIYGAPLIRQELRATPKKALYGAKKLRILLLNAYDSFIKKENQNLKFNKLIETLSKDYFSEYKRNKGNLSNEAMRNDLIIIATATIYQLDIVISDDETTMLLDKAIKSYIQVNKIYGMKNPQFKKYSEFRKELTR